MGRRKVCAALGASGLVLATACGTDTSTLTTEEIQQVLLPVADAPGAVEDTDEHFGAAPGNLNDENDGDDISDLFDGHECAEALQDIGRTDGENESQAYGERQFLFEPGTVDSSNTEEVPYLLTSVTSYEEEASVEEHWNQMQQTCDGEVLVGEDGSHTWEVALEATEVGEFRGLTADWDSDRPQFEDEGSESVLSYANGHQVIQVLVRGMSDDAVQDVLDQQVARVEEGPQQADDQTAAAEAQSLPGEPMVSTELADLLIDEDDFPFRAEEASRDQGVEIIDDDDNDLAVAFLAAQVPVFAGPEDVEGEECALQWQSSIGELLPGLEGNDDATLEGVATSYAESSRRPNSPNDLPAGAAIMLQSEEDGLEDSGSAARWSSLVESCATQMERQWGSQSFEAIDIDGVNGFTSHIELTEGADGVETGEYTSHVAHLEFGNNSLVIIGFGLDEAQMSELYETQLNKLETQ